MPEQTDLTPAEFFLEAEKLTKEAVHSQFKDIPDIFTHPMEIGRGVISKRLSLAMILNSDEGKIALLVHRNWSKARDGNSTLLFISPLKEEDENLLSAGKTQIVEAEVLYRASFGNLPEDFRVTWPNDKNNPQLSPTLEHLETRKRLVEICMDCISRRSIDQVIKSSIGLSNVFRDNVQSGIDSTTSLYQVNQ